MSEWTPPEGATPQDFPGQPRDGVQALVQRTKDIALEMRDRFNNLLKQAGISVDPTGMTIDSSLSVTGSTAIAGPMTVGGTLGVTGNAVFSGNLAVPNGSITNDALTNPVTVVGAATVTSMLWAVSTSMADKATTSIAVPAGYSQAFVMAQASIHFQDSAPNGGYVRAAIGATAGGEMGGLANLNLGQTAFHSTSLTGLSGGAIGLSCQVRATVASGVTTGRIAQIAGFAVFFR